MKKVRILTLFLLGMIVVSCSKDDTEETIVAQKPPTAFELTIAATDITANSARLAWTKSTDPDGTSITYSVMLNGEMMDENIKDLTYELKSLEAATEYKIEVVAKDENKQSTSTKSSFLTKDKDTDAVDETDDVEEEEEEEKDEDKEDEEDEEDEEEDIEIEFAIEVDVENITSESANLRWALTAEQENKTILYDISLSGDIIATDVDGTNFELTGLVGGTLYSAGVTAKSESGQETSESIFFTTLEKVSQPTAFSIISIDAKAFAANLTWEASTDPEGKQVGYAIYIDDEKINRGWLQTNFSVKNLKAETTYVARIVATTAAGETMTETTQEFTTIAGAQPLPDFTITVSDIDSDSAKIAWDDIQHPTDSGQIRYQIYVNDVLQDPASFTTTSE